MRENHFPCPWDRKRISLICISITNILYKIFSGAINKRLYDWAEDNGKID